jgi:hypothetical protein
VLRKYIGVVLGLVLSIVVAGTALAEGYFNSYIINARNGFDSRTWVDHNWDNVSTTVTFRVCRDEDIASDPNDWAKVTVWKHNFILPPTNLGTKQLNCWVTATGNWGDVAAADYNFELTDFSGANADWNVFDVQSLTVNY